MPISSIHGTSSTYEAYSGPAHKNEAASDSSAAASLAKSGTRQTVTAVNTVTGASESQSLQVTPLAVAWAPQMFVQGDKNNDNTMSLEEFQAQLSRTSVSADTAKALFRSFDTSNDGQLSIDEFVMGVSNSIASGSQVFKELMDSYTQAANGNFDQSAADSFLSAGALAADAFWKNGR